MAVPQVKLMDRIEGATWPDTTITLTADGANIANLASYTWAIEAIAANDITGTELWAKTTGFTASATGVVIAWVAGDMGALTATAGRPTSYILELTGTFTAKTLKYQLLQTVGPQIP